MLFFYFQIMTVGISRALRGGNSAKAQKRFRFAERNFKFRAAGAYSDRRSISATKWLIPKK